MPQADPIAASATKLLLKLILPTWSDAIDEADNLWGLLGERLQDNSLAAQTERAVSAIAQQVAEDVRKACRDDAEQAGADKWEVLAHAASEAIANAHVDAELVVDLKLEAAPLLERLEGCRSATYALLSDDATVAHDRILSTAADVISRRAGKLPGFLAQFAKRTLSDHSEQSDYLQQVLATLQGTASAVEQIGDDARETVETIRSLNPARRIPEVERQYLEALRNSREMQHTELFGAKHVDKARKWQISTAYISLGVDFAAVLSQERDASEALRNLMARALVRPHELGRASERGRLWRDVADSALVQSSELGGGDEGGGTWRDLARLLHEASNPATRGTAASRAEGVLAMLGLRPAEVASDLRRIAALLLQRELSVEELLSVAPRVVITGRGGSGKTTLVKWIALRAADGGLPAPLDAWNGKVPIVVTLRSFIGKALPAIQDVPAMADAHADKEAMRPWVDGLLSAGNAIIMVDGMDELPEGQRRSAVACLETLLPRAKHCPIIVTARGHAVAEDLLRDAGFVHAGLCDMDKKRRALFIDHWHEARRKVSGTDAEDVGKAEARIREALDERPDLADLAQTPLLCGLLCALNYEGRADLPSRLSDLYEECWDMLYRKRDTERGLGEMLDREYADVPKEMAQAALGALAYHMIDAGLPRLPATGADAQMDRGLAEFAQRDPRITAEATRRFLIERACILEELGRDGEVQFVHLEFRDHFAAQWALRQAQVQAIANKCDHEEWERCIMLVAASIERRPQDIDQLIAGILRRADTMARGDAKAARRARLLALRCLETEPPMAADTAQRVEEALEALVPARSDDEAAAFALVGPAAVPRLRGREGYSRDEAGNMVAALSRIGDEAAMAAIEEYAEAFGADVQGAAVEAWPQFEAQEYSRRVLSRVLRDGRLHVYDQPDVSGEHIGAMPEGLTDLVLTGLGGIRGEDLRLLPRGLPRLYLQFLSAVCGEHIGLLPPGLVSLGLRALPGDFGQHLRLLPEGLRELVLRDLSVGYGARLQSLPQGLEGLAIKDVDGLSDGGLQGLPEGLGDLRLERLEGVCGEDLQLLPARLQSLTLIDFPGLRGHDLHHLLRLQYLRSLELRSLPQVRSLAALIPLAEQLVRVQVRPLPDDIEIPPELEAIIVRE